MVIAIDLRPLQIGHQNRGIGAYLLNLLHRLPEDKEIKFIFIRHETSKPLEDFNIAVKSDYEELIILKHAFSKNPIKLLRYGIATLLPNFSGLRKHKPDVFFQTDYLLGAPRIRGCRIVTVSYDLIPLKFKQIYLPGWRKYLSFKQLSFKKRLRAILRSWFYALKYKRGAGVLKRSNKIVSISENTKKDLIDLLSIEPKCITVIYPAPSFMNFSESDDAIRPSVKKLIDEINGPFITYIGGTDMRRQIDELVLGFNLYNARVSPLSLVLGGNEFELNSKEISDKAKKAIESSSYNASIHRLGKISESEKAYILNKTAAFVYPTLYEGFGLPLLEAMACGARVITYNNSSIPEIANNYPTYTRGVGGYNIYLALADLLHNNLSQQEAEKYSKAAAAHAHSFSWDKCAESTWNTVVALGA